MELKLANLYNGFLDFKTFNQTRMELKPMPTGLLGGMADTFNQTRMELKRF